MNSLAHLFSLVVTWKVNNVMITVDVNMNGIFNVTLRCGESYNFRSKSESDRPIMLDRKPESLITYSGSCVKQNYRQGLCLLRTFPSLIRFHNNSNRKLYAIQLLTFMYSTTDSENSQLFQQYRGNTKMVPTIEKLFMRTKIITDLFRKF
jgi:hypothetical protein